MNKVMAKGDVQAYGENGGREGVELGSVLRRCKPIESNEKQISDF